MTQSLLLAEAELPVRHMLGFKLRSGGFTVLLAGDGEEALELARSQRPALLLIDQQLTRADGTALQSAIADDAALANIPLVLLTTDSPEMPEPGDRQVCAARLLPKPVSPGELLRVVQELLSPTAAQDVAQTIALKRYAV